MARPRREIVMARCAASAVLAAIEIYNKPAVEYREQTFSLLITNAWEILLKARLVQGSGGKLNVIYRRKQGSRQYETLPGTDQKMTVSLRQALGRVPLPNPVEANIRGIATIRNCAAHEGVLSPELRQRVLEFGTASVQNFVKLSADWFGESVDVPYLLPVGFLGRASLAKGIHPRAQRDLLRALNSIAHSANGVDGSDYCVTLNVEINLNRKLVGGGNIGLTNDPSAPEVKVSDDEALELYPATYPEIVEGCKARYPNFKRNGQFHKIMGGVKADPACAHERRLDPKNPKGQKKFFYNEDATLAKLDEVYGHVQ